MRSGYSWFLECDGCGIWRITVCFSSVYSTVSCPVQLFLFGMRIVRAMPTLSVAVLIACEAAAFSACTLNRDVASASVVSCCPFQQRNVFARTLRVESSS